MPTNQSRDADPLKSRMAQDVDANSDMAGEGFESRAPGSGGARHLKPRILALVVLGLVIAIAGGALVIRYYGHSHSGTETAKTGTGPNKTIADYFAANGITQVPIRVGDSGVPIVTIPPPPGWFDAQSNIQPGVYAEFLYENATDPDDVPFIEVLFSRLDGPADPAKVLEFAPGELRNLPGYEPVSEPATGKLSGYEAIQLGGLYQKNGEERLIAQKTVVIPSGGNGLLVLQMNADAPRADSQVVQLATAWIDVQAKIAP